jgi:hypothetical protein
MFTHRDSIELNPDSFTELSRKIQSEIMPALRLQKGFCDGLTIIAPERASATEDTNWETKEDAEEYQRTGYPEILKILSTVAKTPPTATIFERHPTN